MHGSHLFRLFKFPSLRWVIGAAVLFWVICCGLTLQRYYNFYPTYVSFDQGIFNQVFWNNLHGRWFESSLSSTESSAVMQGELPDVAYRRLGQHFTPALLLWLPFYALFPSPAGLSVLQVTLVTLAGLVLYVLARQYHPPELAAWITVSYYAATAVISPTVANFHDICQIPLYIFGLLLALEQRSGWLWLFAILTLAVREDSGVVLFGVGFYLLASRRHPWIGGGLCGLSLTYMLLLTNLIMPLFSSDISQRFMIEQFGQFVDTPEASTLQVLWGILSHPGRLLLEIIAPINQTLRYLLGQWLPLAFVTIISPEAWLLSGFPTLKLLIQQEAITSLSLHLRYAMTLVPGLFYGAILWWTKHPQLFQNRRFRRFWGLCIGLSLFFTVTSNPNRVLSFLIPDSFQPWVYVSPFCQAEHRQSIQALLAQIPPDASITATDHIVAHLSNRREALRFPMLRFRDDAGQAARVEYAIADLWYLEQYQAAFSDYRKSLKLTAMRVSDLLTKQYGLIDFQDGVALMQRRVDSDPAALKRWTDYSRQLTLTFDARFDRAGEVNFLPGVKK